MQLPSAIVCTPSATNNVLPLPAQASEHIVDAVDRSDAVQSRADAQCKIGSNSLSCFLFLWFDYDLYISDDWGGNWNDCDMFPTVQWTNDGIPTPV